jgi:phage host-nuclease inhibitor protein Gam
LVWLDIAPAAVQWRRQPPSAPLQAGIQRAVQWLTQTTNDTVVMKQQGFEQLAV